MKCQAMLPAVRMKGMFEAVQVGGTEQPLVKPTHVSASALLRATLGARGALMGTVTLLVCRQRSIRRSTIIVLLSTSQTVVLHIG